MRFSDRLRMLFTGRVTIEGPLAFDIGRGEGKIFVGVRGSGIALGTLMDADKARSLGDAIIEQTFTPRDK